MDKSKASRPIDKKPITSSKPAHTKGEEEREQSKNEDIINNED